MVVELLLLTLVNVPYIGLGSTPGPTPEVSLYIEGETEQVVHFRLYLVPEPMDYLARSYFRGYAPQNVTGLNGNGFSSGYAAIKRETRTFRYWLREVLSYSYRDAVKEGLGLQSMESKIYDTAKKLPPLKGYKLVREWELDQPVISFSDDIEIPGIDELEQGLYLLEVSYSGEVAYIPVLKTTLHMEVKVSRGMVLVYLADSGLYPVKNARVRVILNKSQKLDGLTDNRGVALFTRKDSVKNLTVIAVTPDNRLSISSDYFYGWYGSNGPEIKTYLYTDRPIYKPGQTVYITGVIRKRMGFNYLNMPYRTVVLKVSQGWGETYLIQDTLKTDEYGAISDSLTLPDNAKLGNYNIFIEYGDAEVGYSSFLVQEYVKPEFKVSVSTDGDKFVAGGKVNISVRADYIFGAPLKNGDVELNITRFIPWWFYYPGSGNSETVGNLKGTLDDNGHASFDFEIPYDSIPYTYRITATVTGPDGRRISASKRVEVYPSEYIVRIRTDRFVYSSRDSVLQAVIEVKDVKGNPISVDGEVIIYRGWREKTEVNRATFHTDRSGKALITMPLPEASGSYYIDAVVRDSKGHKMVATDWFYRSSYRYRWGGSIGFDVKLNSDTLSVGDTISGILTTPFPKGYVLMTIRAGDTILHYDVIRVRNNMAEINVPVPHGVMGWISLRFDVGGENENSTTEYVLVVDSSRLLNVQVTSVSDEYLPGEEAEFKVRITDKNGRPVRSAFSFGVVDEAIYQLREDMSGDIFKELYYTYHPGWTWEFSSSYFSFYTDRYLDLTELAEKNAEKSAAFAQMKEAAPEAPNSVRGNFKDLAFWTATGRTNGNGEATIKFKLPDNITQWRITVKAYTKDTKVGQTTFRFYARKKVFITISPPRYLTVGDTIEIPTVIHSFLPAQMEFTVDFKTDGLKLLRGGPTTVTVGPNSSKTILWTVVAERPGSVTVQASASTFRAGDAMKLSFPVNPHGLEMAATANIEAYDGTSEQTFTLPHDLKKARNLRADATISTGYISVAISTLPYLKGYPYGCVEQTMSRFLPDIIVRKLARKYGLKVEKDESLQAMIEKGLRRLYSYQHYDGGWGWWKFDESNDEMTGYVMWGLALAKEAGVEVNRSVIKAGLNYIRDRVRDSYSESDVVDLLFAYSFYQPLDDDMKDKLRSLSLSELTPVQQAKLAILAHKIGMEDVSRKALRALEEGNYSEYAFYWINYDEVNLAWKVMAFAETGYLPPEKLQKLTDELISLRRGDRWSSTLSSAYGVMALVSVSERMHETGRPTVVKLYVNGEKVFDGRIRPGDVQKIAIPTDVLKPDTNTLKLKTGKVKTFAAVRANWVSGECPIPAHSVPALTVTRELYRISYRKRHGKWERIETPFDPLTDHLTTSSRLLVKLTIKAHRDVGRLIVEDPVLPGAEIDETDFWQRYLSEYWNLPIAGFERKNDHIAFAIPYLGEDDSVTLSYTLILQSRGIFHLMPTQVYGMYLPDLRANSREFIVRVR